MAPAKSPEEVATPKQHGRGILTGFEGIANQSTGLRVAVDDRGLGRGTTRSPPVTILLDDHP